MDVIQGKVIKLGDDIDTDQILPGYAMAEAYENLGNYAMAGLAELDFKSVYEPGCIIVAGCNFGCGSSREQAPIALQQVGISCILAKSFARIFRRNAINIGLPVWKVDIWEEIKTGDRVTIDLQAGTISLKGQIHTFEKLSDNVLHTLECGGLISRVRRQLGIK